MRIIAIPLARARAGVTPVSTFLAQKTPIKPSFTSHKLAEAKENVKSASTSNFSKQESTNTKPLEEEKKEPLSKRIMSKASAFWVDLGREDQKSTFDWKRRTYTLGEKLMDQIEYEEWALKGVDPSIGPTLTHPKGAQKENSTESSSTEVSGQQHTASKSTPKNVSIEADLFFYSTTNTSLHTFAGLSPLPSNPAFRKYTFKLAKKYDCLSTTASSAKDDLVYSWNAINYSIYRHSGYTKFTFLLFGLESMVALECISIIKIPFRFNSTRTFNSNTIRRT